MASDISQELLTLAQHVRQLSNHVSSLSAKVQSQRDASELVTTAGGDGKHHQRTESTRRLQAVIERGIALATDASDNDAPIRPELYPGGGHRPQARLDALEHSRWDEGPLLDTLKLESFEGFYNLSMQVLALALTYMVARSVYDRGVQLDIADITCPQAWRDVRWAAMISSLAGISGFAVFALLNLWVYRFISWNTAVTMYVLYQTALLSAAVAFAYLTPIAPIPSATILIVVLVVMLKSHSYLATNFAIYKEHVARYGDQLLSSRLSPRHALITGAETAVGTGGGSNKPGSGNTARAAEVFAAHPTTTQPTTAESSARQAGMNRVITPSGASGVVASLPRPPSKSQLRRRRKGSASTAGAPARGERPLAPSRLTVPGPGSDGGLAGGGTGDHGGGIGLDLDGDSDVDDRVGAGGFDASAESTGDHGTITAGQGVARTHPRHHDSDEGPAFSGLTPAGSPSAASWSLHRSRSRDVLVPAARTPAPSRAASDGSATAGTAQSAPGTPYSVGPAVGEGDALAGLGDVALTPMSTFGSASDAPSRSNSPDQKEGPLPRPPVITASGRSDPPDFISGTREQKRRLVKAWPHNVTVRDFAYFLAAPTLVYEPRYPRTKHVRWSYVAQKCGEMGVGMALQYALLRQFLLPILQHPTQPGGPGVLHAALALAFDVLRMSIPSLGIWLLLFFVFFHCAMNASAELTTFADRGFYSDWYNATRLDTFWRKWNVPVHEFALRHVFVELRHYTGATHHVAMLATFFISAVAHELIFSVSFKTLRPWFAIGMLLQVPLMVLGRHLTNRRRGNTIVWMSLYVGQVSQCRRQ